MSGFTSNVLAAAEIALARSRELSATYRDKVKALKGSESVVRLTVSILNQKKEMENELASLVAGKSSVLAEFPVFFPNGLPAFVQPEGGDPAITLLEAIEENERNLGEMIRSLQKCMLGNRQLESVVVLFSSLADQSGKLSKWAKDQRDLLQL